MMSERAKLGLLCFLLLLVLGIAALMVANAFQAMHTLQQESNALKAGDVSTIRPWMTIHVISHVYHVPETYLDEALHIARTDPLRRTTLYEIAASRRQPVEQIIHSLQQTILKYRKEHSRSPTPTPRQSHVLSGTPATKETQF
jgi:hypothetical protein